MLPTRRRRPRRALLVFAAYSLFRCSNDYPLPPTACDDWCRATDRGCREDLPADCVFDCEAFQGPSAYPGCEAEWMTLSSCYAAQPDEAFLCDGGGNSQPRNATCRTERDRLQQCSASYARVCFDFCVAFTERCPDSVFGGPLCDASCTETPPTCQAELDAYFTCPDLEALDCHLENVTELCPTQRDALEACRQADADQGTEG